MCVCDERGKNKHSDEVSFPITTEDKLEPISRCTQSMKKYLDELKEILVLSFEHAKVRLYSIINLKQNTREQAHGRHFKAHVQTTL
ncbi:CLUMA_CG009073, isoform A [Clunio marinus]|uniref:CLUMA_CG009073, isoform A n=1 Tax=Clunio marinus TaxID=568069 RepID=A0A1J1I9G5_9DIPT|nr:CLUMA_CG009073, isoform A [Clunio marinus]